MIHINDIFNTIQGEGFNVGRRSLFVRMPWCNLACAWCDTQFNSFKEWSQEDFLKFATKERTRFAVITGGEPTMHKHTPRVIEILRSVGFEIAIETNGHFPIPAGIDWVCCSPKRDSFNGRPAYFIDEHAKAFVNEYKYVVDHDFDFSILDRHMHMHQLRWLSPEHTNWQRNVDRILDYTTKNPMWRLSLQTHKLIGVA